MDFRYTEEQTLLADTVRRWVEDTYSFDQRRDYLAHPESWRDRWRQLADLGLLAIPFAEHEGGIGGGGVELAIVMEAFGRGLVVEPYLATVVLGGGLLRRGANTDIEEGLIGKIIDGSMTLAFAHGERHSRFDLARVETRAEPKDGTDYLLHGQKSVVIGGDVADRFVVSARTAGSSAERKGITLFLVSRDAPGVEIRSYAMVDGQRAAEIELKGVKLGPEALLGAVDHGLDLIETVVDDAIAAVSAEAVGIMDELNRATLDYLKTRQQFGVPIGKFQVLQHRMAEMTIEYELAKSMAIVAAASENKPAAERARIIAATKTQIGRSGRFVGQQAVQLHGGIGVTDEYKVGHLFKRLTAIDLAFGNADHHQRRFADLPDTARAA